MPKVKALRDTYAPARPIRRPAQCREVFNRIVQHAMIDRGIRTQSQLAELLGMNRASVNKRFNGSVDWTVPETIRLIELLKILPEDVARMMGAAS